MVLNWVATAMPTPIFNPPWRPPNTVCFAFNVSTEHLRTQLDQLHSEAENARAKANSARLRLIRLSEAAEKLQRQAAVCVQAGKENDARELLIQKKKVMQALEKSKSRVELLDELAAKLNGAISAKETLLINNVAVDPTVNREVPDTSNPVWVVSPREEVSGSSEDNEEFEPYSLKSGETQELEANTQIQADQAIDLEPNYIGDSVSEASWNEADMFSSFKGISSYEGFLEHLDKELSKIEMELVAVIRFSNLVLEGEEKAKNLKLQHIVELLEGIQQIRLSVHIIMQSNLGLR